MVRALLLAFAFVAISISSSALVAPASTPAAKMENEALRKMSIDDFLKLTPRKFRELTGEKLTITQRISLKVAQKEVKRAIKARESIDEQTKAAAIDTSDFNVGGFVLGLLLSVVGVLIAYLIGDTSVIKWAWIGFAIWAAIFLLILIL